MTKSLITTIMLFGSLWIILSEKINFESAAIGLGICSWVYFFNRKYRTDLPEGLKRYTAVKYILLYLAVLLREIVIANIQVAKVVLSRKINITPGIIQYKTKLKSELARTILANSISLTPGTLTVFIEEDILMIHYLQKEYVQDILNSKFENILLKIEE